MTFFFLYRNQKSGVRSQEEKGERRKEQGARSDEKYLDLYGLTETVQKSVS